ncbi:alternative ribosome rescue aminoacyl-tRNA hydrolase ArfB [Curvivirga sp.]|uniref:alternative ribosome rescue aminoacyl-tRNA hydrolase ArfB n=1 Tax=Curvivirga sp. TaxID=2856848 RepID=UPI003B592644
MSSLKVTNTIIIEDDELEEKFIRAPGPGGQHVNKTSSAVQLRFNAKACPTLSSTVYDRLKTIASHLITQDGEIIITVTSHRSLQRNRDEARERLCDLIRKATIQPKKRRPTKPSKSAKAKRTDQKKQRGAIKKNRSRVSKHDY